MKKISFDNKQKYLSFFKHLYRHNKRLFKYSSNQFLKYSHPRKTAYIGWIGYNNLGDEILLKAHKRLFSNFCFIPYELNDSAHMYSSVMNKSYYSYGCLGGGTLIDGRNYWLKYIKDMFNQKIPIFCFGTGVSFTEFCSNINDVSQDYFLTWKKILNQFKYIGVRGPRSKKQLESIGVTNVNVVGDTAIALAPITVPQRIHNKCVGICFGLNKESPISGNKSQYFNEMVKTCHKLINTGYTIKLLPIWSEDLPSNILLQTQINDSKCVLNTQCFKSFEDYKNQVIECEYFIGQKLHSTIIATMFRIPSIMVGYRPKSRDYMESISMEKYLISTSDFTEYRTMQLFQELCSNYTRIREKLNIEIMNFRNIQYITARKITDLLLDISSFPNCN